ncbi:MerR family transcriptional regulator [Levilactobacillus brevis]|uniref:MerR family transcriptional regulator n=1 Tax=Levilactobacillus brevis TaxID=1580 RepID=UPI0021A38811|nr:MerR family transcriptional regulator [Levilactobacillus brevis]MCT3567667.1 MerR family transcriptional regulator [Levilactobacillus brevis]
MTVKTVYSAEKTAEMVGISKATLRYYEEHKIIGPINRDVHNYREYMAKDVEWIKVIVLLREMGVPVKSLMGVQETRMQERVDYLKGYRQTVQEKMQQLEKTDNLLAQKITYLETHKL